tara:strand:+ start:10146 stop:10466 length:321 start_codon:yes stop_codon:yes gene_type:complete
MSLYYNRYYKMTGPGGTAKTIPFIKLSEKTTDKFEKYKMGVTRFDKLSQKYYGNSLHGWLIMLANGDQGGLEFTINDGDVIRIPFPFKDTLQEYEDAVNRYIKLNG